KPVAAASSMLDPVVTVPPAVETGLSGGNPGATVAKPMGDKAGTSDPARSDKEMSEPTSEPPVQISQVEELESSLDVDFKGCDAASPYSCPCCVGAGAPSGSSFMGQVFNQHPSVFYLMEPGWHVWGWLQSPAAQRMRMAVRDLIHRIFLCDLSVMDAYMPINYNVSNMFMWSHSRALCSPPACPPLSMEHTTLQIPQCEGHCDVSGLGRAQEACHNYSHVVLKEVRFFELESLYPLLQDPSIDLRILHLVRDPRAVFRSREESIDALLKDSSVVLGRKMLKSDSQHHIMREICRSHIRIYDSAVRKAPDFLRGRYKLLRYEDVVQDPLGEVQRVYDFVGLKMTEPLQEWIHQITHGKSKGTPSDAFKITKRNASAVSQAWRTNLAFKKVQLVQERVKDGRGGVAPRMARSTSRSSGGEREAELSLEEVLRSYEQPLNEEQAWAVCYQCCRGERTARYRYRQCAKGPDSILLHRDGTVTLRPDTHTYTADGEALPAPPVQESQLVQSMGVAIYRALDWGLADNEERDLSPQLEQLIERMVAQEDDEFAECLSSTTKDEGYSGPEDEDEEEEAGSVHAVRTLRQVMMLCARRLSNPAVAPEHYQAVCRALFLETLELQTFLCRIRDAKEMLRRIRTEESQEERCAAELDNLKHTDWARLWVQLMRELRQGVKLKKVEQQPFDPLPTEFSLTPFEMLMQDIRSRRYTLRKVMVDGDIPSRVKQNAHELILDFIRSRPPLKPLHTTTSPHLHLCTTSPPLHHIFTSPHLHTKAYTSSAPAASLHHLHTSTPPCLHHHLYTVSSPPSPLHHLLYTTTFTLSPLHYHLYTTTSTPSPLHHHLYTTTSTPPLSHHHLYTTTFTPSPLHHHLYTLTSIQPPLHHHLYTITLHHHIYTISSTSSTLHVTSTPSPLHHLLYTTTSTPSPLYHLLYIINSTFTPSPLHHHLYTITFTPSPLHHQLYTTTSTPSPLHHHLYTISSTPPPLHHLLYTITFTPPPLHHHLYTTTTSKLSSLHHHLYTIISTPPPLNCHLYTVTFTPPPLHRHLYTITPTPSPLHHYLYTITFTPPPLHHHLYTVIFTPSHLHHLLYTITFTPSPLHHHLYTTTFTPPPLHHHLYTLTSIQPPLHHHLYTITLHHHIYTISSTSSTLHVSERSLPPRPQEQQCLHDRVLAEIRQEHKLRPVERRSSKRPFGSLPCLAHSCHCDLKSTSCIDLSVTEGGLRPLPRPRVLLKAPTLAEMEEMNLFEDEESPDGAECMESMMKRDRSFSEHDLAELLQSEADQMSASVCVRGERPRSYTHTGTTHTRPHRASLPVIGWSPAPPACRSLSEVEEISEASAPSQSLSANQWMEEFSHPVESLALTLDEVISVRRVLVKAEMEKFLQSKELYNNLRKGKVCCCCRVKFPLFSWPSTCLLCKRSVCGSCSAKMKMPSKKLAHIPVYAVGFHSSPRSHSQRSDVYKSLRSLSRRAVEDEFPYLYVAGCSLRDVCAECTKFVADVVSSSRRSLDIINNTPKREKPRPRPTSHYMPPRGGVN
ncbi:hypothetical protein QTP86_030431, partial [Hemibagrus guttatus]